MYRAVDQNQNKVVSRQVHEGAPSPVDVYVGSRIRLRRTLFGVSQQRLGDALGVTFQQIQKYERGVNRVGASCLFAMSQVLNVSVSYFFDDMPQDILEGPVSGPRGRMHHAAGGEKPSYSQVDNQLSKQETRELVDAYYRITEPSIRKRVFDLIKSLVSPEGDLEVQ